MKDIITKFATDYDGVPGTIGGGGSDIAPVIIGILNGVVGLLAVVCVVVVVIGGVNYMTAAGDSNKVKKGRDTILYAIIGLIICALAATIVNTVIVNLLGNV